MLDNVDQVDFERAKADALLRPSLYFISKFKYSYAVISLTILDSDISNQRKT
jgi:hypothetical protein